MYCSQWSIWEYWRRAGICALTLFLFYGQWSITSDKEPEFVPVKEASENSDEEPEFVPYTLFFLRTMKNLNIVTRRDLKMNATYFQTGTVFYSQWMNGEMMNSWPSPAAPSSGRWTHAGEKKPPALCGSSTEPRGWLRRCCVWWMTLCTRLSSTRGINSIIIVFILFFCTIDKIFLGKISNLKIVKINTSE